MGIGEHCAVLLEVAEAETEDAVVVAAARRWRFLLLVLFDALVLLALLAVEDTVAFADVEAAVVLILATAEAATGEPVMEVVVKVALGLCADIWERMDEMAASVF